MSSKLIKRKLVNHDILFRQKVKKNLFPSVCEIDNVPIDKSLKPLKIISTSPNNLLLNNQSISFELACENSNANVYLFLNKKKRDMYYSIPKGKYTFKNVLLNQDKNSIEIFYVIEGSKSPSTFLVVKA